VGPPHWAERHVDKLNAVRQNRFQALRKALWEVLMTPTLSWTDLKSQWLPASTEVES